MIGGTNAFCGGSSGGILKAWAVIRVAYPVGSTCTCTKGTKTLRAKDTTGTVLFSIPEAGDWVVSCTDNESSFSKTVSITTQYQVEDVQLHYGYYLFEEGVGALPTTIPYYYNGVSHSILSIGTDKIQYTVDNQNSTSDIEISPTGLDPGQYNPDVSDMIDLTDYSTLNAEIEIEWKSNPSFSLNSYLTFYGRVRNAENTGYDNVAASRAFSEAVYGRFVLSADLSNNSYLFYYWLSTTYGAFDKINIYNIWLE